MVAMLDEDQSGKLGFLEFQKLLTEIARWKAVFKLYDTDRSGHLNPFELRAALQSAGYHLNSKILNNLMHRYGSREGEIWFDDFITCAVKIKTMIGKRMGGVGWPITIKLVLHPQFFDFINL